MVTRGERVTVMQHPGVVLKNENMNAQVSAFIAVHVRYSRFSVSLSRDVKVFL